MKGILYIILVTIVVFMSSSASPNYVECVRKKLYGNWLHVDSYNTKLSSIDTLPKVNKDHANEISRWQLLRNGKFINDYGDYKSIGKYSLDGCILKLFDADSQQRDTISFHITYIDKNYLLLYVQTDNPLTYYFRKMQ